MFDLPYSESDGSSSMTSCGTSLNVSPGTAEEGRSMPSKSTMPPLPRRFSEPKEAEEAPESLRDECRSTFGPKPTLRDRRSWLGSRRRRGAPAGFVDTRGMPMAGRRLALHLKVKKESCDTNS